MRTRIAIPVMACALALSMGLVACGGSSAASSSAASASSAAEAASSAAAAETASASAAESSSSEMSLDDVLYYEGTFENGDSLIYGTDQSGSGEISLAIIPADESRANESVIIEAVPTVNSDGTIVLKGDDGTELTLKMADDGASVEISGYGTASLTPVTQSDFEKDLAEAAAK